MSTRYTVGSILQFSPAPDGMHARFAPKDGAGADGREAWWSHPIVGWAVYVRWVREDADEVSDEDMETAMTPVILDDEGYPRTVPDYFLDYPDAVYKGVLRNV